ncbi:probable fucosyltransferase 8 [Neltuma alba]|uniref:probable fucosyltransferase 8 n=1 Tax=Neltuma alba TaxID=207710 RepID=UPI0010A4EAA6|nr:probable fucosyltransferase 8 [Prosopis alba]
MGLSSDRYRISLVVLCTIFLILCGFSYKYSIFDHVGSFSKDKAFEGRGQNLTHKNLGSIVEAIADSEAGRGQNLTHGNLGSTIQAIANSEAVSRNYSLKNSTEDSSLLTRKPTADKLFDGLLTSAFDKTSCLSRFQSYLYHKASPHKPSPYLITKLGKYEDLHKRCGPHTRLYNKTIKELIRPRKRGHSAVCNYIVWTSVNGLGNRMVSMASAFLYALLTDRVLMVDFEDEMTGLFCEPFPNSSWLLPNDFPFINKPRHIETYQNMIKKDRENSSGKVSPLVLHLYLQHTSDDSEKFFHCDHSHRLLSKVPLLILRSDQYFVPSLFIVPSFSQELRKMFPEKDTVFHHLGRYLFLPSNQVWGIINRFYQAYMARADERIGLQIRVYPDLSTNQAKMDQILRCTLRNNVLPELDLRDSVTSPRKNQTKSVLVTSLYSYFSENLTTMYLKKPTVTGDIIGVYQPSHEKKQKSHDNMHNVKALTEIYLLSMCDVLVTSSISSFGYVAQSLGGSKPWILHKLLDNNVPDPPCVRDFSMEPCFHYPPKHDCTAKPMDENGKAFPYTRPCLDQRIGMKLVNDRE